MRLIIIGICFLIGCTTAPNENLIDQLTLDETGGLINGYWKLEFIESADGTTEISESDNLDYYEFDGSKGYRNSLVDNLDVTFDLTTDHVFCKLKEQNGIKSIEYTGLTSHWEFEIKKISKRELILSDSSKRWVFNRYGVND